MNMKIQMRCFKVTLNEKNHHCTIKIYRLQTWKKRSTLDWVWICTTSDRIKGWTFANFIQGAVLDHITCFSYSLTFWGNLFNYFSLPSIFGKFQIYWFIFCRHDYNNDGMMFFTRVSIFMLWIAYFLHRKRVLTNTISFHQSYTIFCRNLFHIIKQFFL